MIKWVGDSKIDAVENKLKAVEGFTEVVVLHQQSSVIDYINNITQNIELPTEFVDIVSNNNDLSVVLNYNIVEINMDKGPCSLLLFGKSSQMMGLEISLSIEEIERALKKKNLRKIKNQALTPWGTFINVGKNGPMFNKIEDIINLENHLKLIADNAYNVMNLNSKITMTKLSQKNNRYEEGLFTYETSIYEEPQKVQIIPAVVDAAKLSIINAETKEEKVKTIPENIKSGDIEIKELTDPDIDEITVIKPVRQPAKTVHYGGGYYGAKSYNRSHTQYGLL